MERRTRRSPDRGEALHYLLESVAARSDVRALAVVGPSGDVLASLGPAEDIAGLATLAGPWLRGEPCDEEFDRVTEGTDLIACSIPCADKTLHFAALGTRVRKLTEAARGVQRIIDGQA